MEKRAMKTQSTQVILQNLKTFQTSSKPLSLKQLNDFGIEEANKMLHKYQTDNKQKIVDTALGQSGIPVRFQKKTFDDFETIDKESLHNKQVIMSYANNFERILESGTCLVLAGNSGTGKTHLATSVLNQIAERNFSAIFSSVSEILRRLRDSYNQSGETESEIYELYTKPDLLVIDEVGVSIGDIKKRQTMLFDLINSRYNNLKPTILISNLNIKGINKELGTRMFDRLQENSGIMLTFNSQSFRKNMQI